MLTIIRRSWRSLVSDRTRLSIGLSLAFVGLLFWARLIVIQDMPRTAVADPEVAAPEPDVESRTNDAEDDAVEASVDAGDATPGSRR